MLYVCQIDRITSTNRSYNFHFTAPPRAVLCLYRTGSGNSAARASRGEAFSGCARRADLRDTAPSPRPRRGADAAVAREFTQAHVQRFDAWVCVGGVDHFADLGRKPEERDDVVPIAAPQADPGAVFYKASSSCAALSAPADG